MLSNKNDELQIKIVKYLKENFDNINYKFIFNPIHIIEKNLNHIDKTIDFVLWHPVVCSNNLWLVRQFHNSVAILQNKTILLQKISKRNPINENLAINNGFKLLYIEPNYDDVTNAEWKLVIQEDDYSITIEKIIKLNTKQ